jgi:hypothetical protein
MKIVTNSMFIEKNILFWITGLPLFYTTFKTKP